MAQSAGFLLNSVSLQLKLFVSAKNRCTIEMQKVQNKEGQVMNYVFHSIVRRPGSTCPIWQYH